MVKFQNAETADGQRFWPRDKGSQSSDRTVCMHYFCDRREIPEFQQHQMPLEANLAELIKESTQSPQEMHRMNYKAFSVFTLAVAAIWPSSNALGQFEIRYDVSSLTAAEQATLQPVLDDAATFWESIIPGYQPGVTLDGIDIDVSAIAIDGNGNGGGNILAQAGPGPGAPFSQGGFEFITNGTVFNNGASFGVTSSVGTLQFDEADLNTPLLLDVTKHEIAHALGFGTLFVDNNLVGATGQYTGAEGVAAYQAEYDSTALFVPLENDDAHWLESLTLQDSSGRVFGDELLSPIIENTPNLNDPDSNFVSNTTIGVLRDLGYDAVFVTAVPEPAAATLLCLAGIGLYSRRRKAIC